MARRGEDGEVIRRDGLVIMGTGNALFLALGIVAFYWK